MALTPRTRSQIRDELLANWAARYAAQGRRLLTIEGSDAYLWADALAVELEAQEAQAEFLTHQILPDEAATSYLDRHGSVEGVARDAAVAAVLDFIVTGTPTTLITFGTSVLTTSSGLRFAPVDPSATTDGGGNVTVGFRCTTTGTAGNLADSTTATWDSTPVDANPTATVTGAPTTPGAAQETDASYAARIILRRQERPASGNRADWRAWADDVTGVEEVYVYPLVNSAGTPNTLGTVTALLLGAAQGDSVTDTRQVSGTIISNAGAYVEGTGDVDGAAVDGEQLRPTTVPSGNYTFRTKTALSQAVDLSLTLSAANALPFAYAGGATINSYAAGPPSVLTIAALPAGLVAGMLIAIPVGTGARRGGYKVAKVTAIGGAGPYTLTLDRDIISATAGQAIRPEPANGEAIRAAVFGFFDRLGPGDTSPASRWPTVETTGRATLYRGALAAAVIATYGANGMLLDGVAGVLNANVTTPAGNVTPAAFEIVSMTTLVFNP